MSHKWSYATEDELTGSRRVLTVDWLNSACSCGFKNSSVVSRRVPSTSLASRFRQDFLNRRRIWFSTHASVQVPAFLVLVVLREPPCKYNAFIHVAFARFAVATCCTSSLLGNAGAPELRL